MKLLIRLALIAAVAYWGLSNYALVSGTKTVFNSEKVEGLDAIKEIVSIQHIYYYQNPFSNKADDYIVIIETKENIHLMEATEIEITAMKVAGFFMGDYAPKELSPIPWWAFGIGILVIMCFPDRKDEKK